MCCAVMKQIAQGMGWMTRKIVNAMSSVQHITQTGTHIQTKTDTSFGSQILNYHLGGGWEEFTQSTTGKVKHRAWVDPQTKNIHTANMRLEGDQSGLYTTTNWHMEGMNRIESNRTESNRTEPNRTQQTNKNTKQKQTKQNKNKRFSIFWPLF